jgi:hypothetical protein
MNNVVRPKRVSSSTAPAKPVPSSSSAYSNEDCPGWYAANSDIQFTGQEKHMLQMVDGLSDEAADEAISNFF